MRMRREWRLWVVGAILLLFMAEMALQIRRFYQPTEELCRPCLQAQLQADGFDYCTNGEPGPGWKRCPRCGAEWTSTSPGTLW
jgi:hypothetical protein